MRILAGLYKGRSIEAPRGIRPTQDNVRKALFDILGDLAGQSFLDLYAGSGAVGLEAASRGASPVVLVEKEARYAGVLKRNSTALDIRETQLLIRDAPKAVKQLCQQGRNFDIVFWDPPYYRDLAKKILHTLDVYAILAPTGYAIAQHFKKECLPEKTRELELFRQNYYGDTVLSFYRKYN